MTRALVFGACAILLLLTLIERRSSRKRFAITAPFLALAVALVATALQLVPLPRSVLAWASPAAHETLVTTLSQYRFHPVSLDPPGTLAELAKIAAYVCFFAAATMYATRPQRRRMIVLGVAGIATVCALMGILQFVTGNTKPLFFYVAESAMDAAVVRGPFVNQNHLGALLVLGAACSLNIGLRDAALRIPAALSVIAINVAVVLTLSRSAIIAAPLAQVVTFALDRWQMRQVARSRPPGLRASLVLAGIAAAAIAISIVAERVKHEVTTTMAAEISAPLSSPSSKFVLVRDAGHMIWRYPWTGAGRGAFEQAFTQHSEGAGQTRHVWVENGYIQAAADWGVPVALLLLVLAGWSLLIGVRGLGRDDPYAVGALGALLGLAAHEAVDFSIELPGVALPALALVAILFSRRSSEPDLDLRRVTVRAWHLALPIAVLVLLGLSMRSRTAEADGRELVRLVRDRSVPTDVVLTEGQRLKQRHPADYYIHALVAERLARVGHDDTLRWINDAIYLNPRYPSSHVMAAEFLATKGQRAQALLEYRTAVQLSGNPMPIYDAVARHYPGVKDMLGAAPDTPGGLLRLATWLGNRQRYADAERPCLRVLELDPNNVEALQFLVQLALLQNDSERAMRWADQLLARDQTVQSVRLAARARIAGGELEEATGLLRSDRTAAGFEIGLSLALAYSSRGDFDAARAQLDHLDWVSDRRLQVRLHETRAEIELRAGNKHQHDWELEQAARLRVP